MVKQSLLIVGVIGVVGLVAISIFVSDPVISQIMSAVVVGFMGTICTHLMTAHRLEKEMAATKVEIKEELSATKVEIKETHEKASVERAVQSQEIKKVANEINGRMDLLLELKEAKGFAAGKVEGKEDAGAEGPKKVVIVSSEETLPVKVENT